jgi:hypothetical protein
VVSRKDGIFTGAQWDLDNVQNWAMTVFSHEEAAALVSDKFPEGSGTEIIWTKLNRLLENETINFDAFNSLLNEAEREISLVFHRYISGELDHRTKLTIARNNRELIPFDPFCRANISTQQKDLEVINFQRSGKSKKIKIKPFILPHFSQLSKSEHEQLGGREGYVKNQGFYIYREYRLIIRGTWFKLVPHGEFSKLARIRVDIPNSLDIDWKISVDKSEAELPWELRLRLKNLLATWVLPDAVAPIIKRKTTLQTQIKPVWNRQNSSAGAWHFSVNNQHPLISSFVRKLKPLDKLDGHTGLTSQFNEIVRLIEKTLPLENIKSAMDDNFQTMNAGYTELQEILDLAMMLRDTLIKQNHSQADVEEMLRTTVPFSTYLDQLNQHFKDNPITG